MKKRKKPSPCKNCNERTEFGLCHMTCKRYLEWEKETKEIDEYIKDEKNKQADASCFIYRGIKVER